MNILIAGLIHSSTGYFHETAGVVMGFFNDAEHAQLCAHKIATTLGKISQVCGSQLSVPL